MDRTKRPSFFWQGTLILLPMFALTLVGLFSLWRDQINSRREADERAAQEAARIVKDVSSKFRAFPSYSISPSSDSSKVRIELFGETCRFLKKQDGAASLFALNAPGTEQTYRFNPAESWPSTPLTQPLEDPVYRLSAVSQNVCFCLLDANGNLTYPPPLDETPQPVAEKGAVAASLRSQWLQKQFGDPDVACQWFESVAMRHPDALSESGLPLQVLARYQAASLRLAGTNSSTSGPWLIALAATAVLKPSAISAPVLEQVKKWTAQSKCSEAERKVIEGWLQVWAAHEQSREIWHEFRRAGQTNWVDAAGGQWVVCESKNPGVGCNVLMARPADLVRKELYRALEGNVDAPYLAVYATVAGSFSLELRKDKVRAAQQRSPTNLLEGLSSVDIAFPGDSKSSLLKINCVLERSDLLYAAQRRREMIFALFLGVAAISATAGFITAKRAFARQLQVSEMKSNFVSAVSHELRAPIASVRLMAEGMDRGKISDPARQKEYFRFIVQECRRLSSLIENVLDFSRIEQGRKKYEFEPTDLVALTRQTVNVMLPYAAERQVDIRVQLPEGSFPQPSCDGLAIQQALVNLIDNAVKHSPAGSVIRVGLEVSAKNRTNGTYRTDAGEAIASLHLWVEDQGSGIPAEEHEKIFERFYRRGSELRRETQGVGIGLSIVKHIIEAHGGRVCVDSAVGKGSRFVLEIPVEREEN